MCVRAGEIFLKETLTVAGVDQSIDDYHNLLTRTSGLSLRLAKANSGRLAAALQMTAEVVDGLSRGLPYEVFNTGIGVQGGANVRLNARVKCLGCCMPNNSPGVHVTWLVCPAFGIPVLIRPGSSEPFTPLRLIAALIKAGFPPEAFGYYPCDHGAANRIPELTGAAIVFGSDETVSKWKSNPLVQVHGAGFSKVFLGPDLTDSWQALVPQLAENVYANSGRSCFTASDVITEAHGKEIAEGIAREMGSIIPLPLDHLEARLSAMAMPGVAKSVNASIEEGLKLGGAIDMSAPYQPNGRLVEFEGRTYLLPTVILCDSLDHPLARKEFLFPYVAVVQCSMDEAFAKMGPTLSLAVYTRDSNLVKRAMRSPVNLVSINVATSKLDRRQPHEGDLFDKCFQRSSLVLAPI